MEKAHVFKKSVVLKPGINNISILAMTVGLPVSYFFFHYLKKIKLIVSSLI